MAPGRFAVASLLTAGVVGVQVLISHGAAAGGQRGAAIITAEVVHILAAGAWLGSLLPLLVILGLASPSAAAVASRRFSPIGIGCVLLLALTASALAFLLVGGFPGLLGTDYGRVILVKLGLFLALLALAAGNRFVFTSALRRNPELSRSRLIWSVSLECVLGLLVIVAAARLASLDPGVHGYHHHSAR
jgi:putative copper resistance protein D